MGGPTTSQREAARLRDRLTRVQDALRRERANERVLAEQVDYLRELADNAETRKLVSQTPLADREWRTAATDLDRHHGQLQETRARIAELGEQRDRHLDRLFELETL